MKTRRLILFVILVLAPPIGPDQLASISTRVEGSVREKGTGRPISGATVYLHMVAPEPNYWSAVTDQQGHFRIAPPEQSPPGSRFYVSCEKTGFVPHLPSYYYGSIEPPTSRSGLPESLYNTPELRDRILGVFGLPEGRIARVDIELDTGGMLRGRLQARTSSGLVAYTEPFTLERKTDPVSESFFATSHLDVVEVQPDEQGQFQVGDLVPSPDYYFVEAPAGYARRQPVNISVQKDQVTQLEHVIDLTNITGIKGTLTVNHQPDSSLIGDVVLKPLSALAGLRPCVSWVRDGTYSCLGMVPGAYTAQASAYDPAGHHYETELVVEIRQGVTRIEDLNLLQSTTPR